MNTKAILISAALVVASLLFAARQSWQVSRMETELSDLKASASALNEEIETLRSEREGGQVRRSPAVAPRTSGAVEIAATGDASELMRLRSQVANLSRKLAEQNGSMAAGQKRAAAAAAAEANGGLPSDGNNMAGLLETVVAARVTQLRDKLEQNPGLKIPELGLLTEQDWKEVVKQGNWENSDELLETFKTLRIRAKARFAGTLGPALRRFALNNGGNLPGDLNQVASFFDPPVDSGILSRYSMIQSGPLQNLAPNQYVVKETMVVDPQHDTQFSIGLSGYLQGSVVGRVPGR
jgi:hypothetical protein